MQPNFNAKWALYSIIDSTNLAEFEVWRRLFLNGSMSVVSKKKNMKKFGQLLEPCISGTAGPIPLKFDT